MIGFERFPASFEVESLIPINHNVAHRQLKLKSSEWQLYALRRNIASVLGQAEQYTAQQLSKTAFGPTPVAQVHWYALIGAIPDQVPSQLARSDPSNFMGWVQCPIRKRIE